MPIAPGRGEVSVFFMFASRNPNVAISDNFVPFARNHTRPGVLSTTQPHGKLRSFREVSPFRGVTLTIPGPFIPPASDPAYSGKFTCLFGIGVLGGQRRAGDQHWSTNNGNLPLMDYLTPNPYIPVDSNVSACKRLTSLSHAHLPHEVISLIEAVFKSKDEVKMIGHLRRDDAQTFIDVIHKVRLHPLHLHGTV
jgi:hypothetical protein